MILRRQEGQRRKWRRVNWEAGVSRDGFLREEHLFLSKTTALPPFSSLSPPYPMLTPHGFLSPSAPPMSRWHAQGPTGESSLFCICSRESILGTWGLVRGRRELAYSRQKLTPAPLWGRPKPNHTPSGSYLSVLSWMLKSQGRELRVIFQNYTMQNQEIENICPYPSFRDAGTQDSGSSMIVWKQHSHTSI